GGGAGGGRCGVGGGEGVGVVVVGSILRIGEAEVGSRERVGFVLEIGLAVVGAGGRIVDGRDLEVDRLGVAGGGARAGRDDAVEQVGRVQHDRVGAVVVGVAEVARGRQRGVDVGERAVERHGGVRGAVAGREGGPRERRQGQRAVARRQRRLVHAAGRQGGVVVADPDAGDRLRLVV